MADPISIAGIAQGSVGLILQCGGVIKSLNEIAGTLKQARLTILSMRQEVETIEMAWTKIRDWSQSSAEAKSNGQEIAGVNHGFLERLDRSLDCGLLVMSALREDLSEFITINPTEKITFGKRTKIAWNEKALQGHQNRIRGQVLSMNLLLQVLNLPALQDKKPAFQGLEVDESGSSESCLSIVPSKISSGMSESARTFNSSASERSVELVYQRLSFENDLFTTRVYKRNYRTPFIDALRKSRRQEVDESPFINDQRSIPVEAKHLDTWLDDSAPSYLRGSSHFLSRTAAYIIR